MSCGFSMIAMAKRGLVRIGRRLRAMMRKAPAERIEADPAERPGAGEPGGNVVPFRRPERAPRASASEGRNGPNDAA